jgi:hypothetical protein
MTNISCKKWITATEKTHKLEQNDIFHQSIGQAPMDLMIKLFKVCDNVTVHRQCVHCAQTVCAQTVCAFLPCDVKCYAIVQFAPFQLGI